MSHSHIIHLTEEFADPKPKQLQETQSASIHNIYVERTLGLTDSLICCAPNANMGFIDGKVRGKLNKVIEWLDSKDAASQRQMLKSAIPLGMKTV